MREQYEQSHQKEGHPHVHKIAEEGTPVSDRFHARHRIIPGRQEPRSASGMLRISGECAGTGREQSGGYDQSDAQNSPDLQASCGRVQLRIRNQWSAGPIPAGGNSAISAVPQEVHQQSQLHEVLWRDPGGISRWSLRTSERQYQKRRQCRTFRVFPMFHDDPT